MDHAVARALNAGDHEERLRQLGALTANAAGALVMALCAVLALAGAAIGGGLIAGTGDLRVVVGAAVLAGVVALVLSRRRPGEGC